LGSPQILEHFQMTKNLFQYTKVEESEAILPGYGAARRVYNATGPLPTLPEGVSTMYDNFMHGVKISGDKNMMGHRPIVNGVAGPYVWQSYNQISKRVINLAAGFVKLGMKQDTNIALFSINRPEWIIAEQACFVQGLVTVPLYDTLGAEAIEYITNLCETPMICCTADKIAKILVLAAKIPSIKFIVTMDIASDELKASAEKAGVKIHSIEEVEKLGAENAIEKAEITSEAIATICFTSGTTGVPKGVVLTHGNVLSFTTGSIIMGQVGHMYKFSDSDVHLSYLPLAHIFERVIITTLVYYGGSFGFFQGDTLKLLADAEVLRPTMFVSVPRLYNKIYDKVMAGVKAKGGIAEALFNMAFKSKKSALNSGSVTHKLWDAIVFKKIAAKLGGRVRILFSGAAPISGEVLDFLKIGFSCPVVEGYGQTENCAAATSHIYADHTVGHIGVPNPSNHFY
jgi:long-chain acyl-CoA synthetase